jgi:hypothetical protein
MYIPCTLNTNRSKIEGTCLIEFRVLYWLALNFLCVLLFGCSGGVTALKPPVLDPKSAAKGAIGCYDKDGDGNLSLLELEACPGILESIAIYDLNNDKIISQEEIAQRLEKFVNRSVALARLSATVRFNNRPLGGASIRFIPETYLGDEIKPALGQTRQKGSATMAVADGDLPENQRGIRGIHTGTYRVEITHPEVKIPAKYNTETELGYETTPGNPYAKFDLKSR